MSSYDQLYATLIRELDHCGGRGLPLLISIELRFRIAEQYNRRLLKQVEDNGFTDPDDEINFYKNILPKFIAESAYYCLLNYAHNFCPADSEEKNAFWNRQANRIEKYKQRYPEFVAYYESGENRDDLKYYMRPLPGEFPKHIGELMARERYARYAQEQMS